MVIFMHVLCYADLSSTSDLSRGTIRASENGDEVEEVDSLKRRGTASDSETRKPMYPPLDDQNQAALQEVSSDGGAHAAERTETNGKDCSDSRSNSRSRTVEQSQASNELHRKETHSAAQTREESSDVEKLCTSQGFTDEVPIVTNLQSDSEQVEAEEEKPIDTEMEVTASEHTDETEIGNEGRPIQPVDRRASDEPMSTVSGSNAMVAPVETSSNPNTEVLPTVSCLSAEGVHNVPDASSSGGVASVDTGASQSSEVVPVTVSLSPRTVATAHADMQQSSDSLAEEVAEARRGEREDILSSSSSYILVEQDGVQRKVLDTATFESEGLLYAREDKSSGIKTRDGGLPPVESATEALEDDPLVVEEQEKEHQVLPAETSSNEETGKSTRIILALRGFMKKGILSPLDQNLGTC